MEGAHYCNLEVVGSSHVTKKKIKLKIKKKNFERNLLHKNLIIVIKKKKKSPLIVGGPSTLNSQ